MRARRRCAVSRGRSTSNASITSGGPREMEVYGRYRTHLLIYVILRYSHAPKRGRYAPQMSSCGASIISHVMTQRPASSFYQNKEPDDRRAIETCDQTTPYNIFFSAKEMPAVLFRPVKVFSSPKKSRRSSRHLQGGEQKCPKRQ